MKPLIENFQIFDQQLVSSLTVVEFANQEYGLLFACTKATESKTAKLETTRFEMIPFTTECSVDQHYKCVGSSLCIFVPIFLSIFILSILSFQSSRFR